MTGEAVGYYDLTDIARTRETAKQKGSRGLVPWCKSKIRRMVKEGTFPKPMTDGYRLIWPKEVIHDYLAKNQAIF